ncbi:hypothetical protein Tco_0067501 [Tanacetum coccineum]
MACSLPHTINEIQALVLLRTNSGVRDSGPSHGLYLCRIDLRYRCARTELITSNLICPSTYQLLRSSGGDSGPNMSFDNMAGVRRLSAHVIKLRDMPEGVLVLSRLSRVWKNRICDPVLRGVDRNVVGIHDFLCLPKWTGVEVQEERHHDIRPALQRLPFYYTPLAATDVVIPDPTPEDLDVGTPSTKIFTKAEASQKRKASTSGATSSHIAKRTKSALAQSSGSTTRPGPFIDNSDNKSDDDDNACVEILLVTPIRFAAVIPSLGNQGGSSAAPAAEGPSIRGQWHYGQCCGVAGNCEFTRKEWDAPYRPTFRVLTKEVFKDLVIYSRLKGYEERVVGLTELELQASALKSQVSGLNDKLSSSDASFAKYKDKGNERKKNIKSLTKSLDNLHAEGLVQNFLASDAFSRVHGELLSLAASVGFKRGLSMHRTKDEFAGVLEKMAHFAPGAKGRLVEASPLVAQTNYAFLNKIFEHVVEPLSVILQLKPKKLARPANVPASKDARVSPPIAKESTVTPSSESLELPTNVLLASSTVASEQNEEWVNAMVDGPDPEITNGVVNAKSGSVFVQGTSCVLDDTFEVTKVGSERVSSDLSDVVVAPSAGKKGRFLVFVAALFCC